MAWTTKPARFNLRLVRAVLKSLATGERPVLPAILRPLPVAGPEGGTATTYTVCLVRDDEGTYMATCRELPDVLVFEDSEEQALAVVQVAIVGRLQPGVALTTDVR